MNLYRLPSGIIGLEKCQKFHKDLSAAPQTYAAWMRDHADNANFNLILTSTGGALTINSHINTGTGDLTLEAAAASGSLVPGVSDLRAELVPLSSMLHLHELNHPAMPP